MPPVIQLVRMALVYFIWPTGHWAQAQGSSDWAMTHGTIVVTVHANGTLDVCGFSAGVLSTLLPMMNSTYVDNYADLVSIYNSGHWTAP